MILNDAIKTIQNGFFVLFCKVQKLVSFQNTQNIRNKKKQEGCFFKKMRVCLNPDIFRFFFVIFPWSHDLEQVTVYVFNSVCTAHLE